MSPKNKKGKKESDKALIMMHIVFLTLTLFMVVTAIFSNNHEADERLINKTLLTFGIDEYELTKKQAEGVENQEIFIVHDTKRDEKHHLIIEFTGTYWKQYKLKDFYEGGVDTRIKEGIIDQVAEEYLLDVTDEDVLLATLERIPVAFNTESSLYRLTLKNESYMAEWDSGTGSYLVYHANSTASTP